jgi:hypothetical protein
VNVTISVTRLGEFSPLGDFFSFNCFLEVIKVADIFGLLFPTDKVTHYFFAKMDWVTFWANFSQTHLVTLVTIAQECSTYY